MRRRSLTKEELKKKIVEIIINAIWKDAEADYDSTDETEAGSIAEALIAAGIGDVETTRKIGAHATAMAVLQAAKAEHRAEVAERALKNACTNVIKDEEDDIAVEPRANVLYKAYLRQAEKELAEERKDEQG